LGAAAFSAAALLAIVPLAALERWDQWRHTGYAGEGGSRRRGRTGGHAGRRCRRRSPRILTCGCKPKMGPMAHRIRRRRLQSAARTYRPCEQTPFPRHVLQNVLRLHSKDGTNGTPDTLAKAAVGGGGAPAVAADAVSAAVRATCPLAALERWDQWHTGSAGEGCSRRRRRTGHAGRRCRRRSPRILTWCCTRKMGPMAAHRIRRRRLQSAARTHRPCGQTLFPPQSAHLDPLLHSKDGTNGTPDTPAKAAVGGEDVPAVAADAVSAAVLAIVPLAALERWDHATKAEDKSSMRARARRSCRERRGTAPIVVAPLAKSLLALAY
jgi:hypothetical protein